MDTLPASVTRPNGDLVVASIPANTRITVGKNTYVFLGWDAPQRVINGADVTFVGTWSLETDSEGDADDDGHSDDGRIVIYKYQIIDDLGTVLEAPVPEDVLATMPSDLDEEDYPIQHDSGESVAPDSPSLTQVSIEGENGEQVVYTWMCWDKNTDTFEDDPVVFTGSWTFTVIPAPDQP